MKTGKFLKYLSCGVFASLYVLVAVISLICSTEFFALAHSGTMSWVLAIGFEIGAMACLLSTLILPKNKQGLVWIMFVILTLFQCMSNTYMAYAHLENFTGWIELFGLNELEPMAQKRILASISGAILPLVALGFIRIMANLISGEKTQENGTENETMEALEEPTEQEAEVEQENRELEQDEPQSEVSEIEESWDESEDKEPEENNTVVEEDSNVEEPQQPVQKEVIVPSIAIPKVVRQDKQEEPVVEEEKETVEEPKQWEKIENDEQEEIVRPNVPKSITENIYNPSTNEYMD